MDGSQPSTGEIPPDLSPKKHLIKAHKPPKPASPNKSPAATNQRRGEAITVARSRLGASKNSQVNSGTKSGIPPRGGRSHSQKAPLLQKLAIATEGINPKDQKKISANTKLAGDEMLAGQPGQEGYQIASNDTDISLHPSILYGYQSTSSILKSLNAGS
ncbi:hypothetical protein A4A49_65101, partial [Nicotiana attenuata]